MLQRIHYRQSPTYTSPPKTTDTPPIAISQIGALMLDVPGSSQSPRLRPYDSVHDGDLSLQRV
ncbi:hypothetical protein BIU95_17065 [Curtobacterium sp. MCBA15_007]|uniref:hypothetical protein n=1 Tax=Curtobacterium sp. MCBA15_007 TaxID=1898735 RepID=UPI0008DD4D77|nr:hypothetical protein [Curtobacterium sp. MCBA15_007]OII04221.1 hypothetical protein BIU95_17065 [Curtobacterium sp. MCBA15_007]